MGVDPGLVRTGFGIIEMNGQKAVMKTYGVVCPPAGLDFFSRLKYIRDGLTGIIEEYLPREMAIEDIFYHRNAKAALALGHARGAAIIAGMECGLALYQYTALQVKKAIVGYGRADKSQVQQMVKVLLNLPGLPKPDDASDALAVALTHCIWGRRSNEMEDATRNAGRGGPGRR